MKILLPGGGGHLGTLLARAFHAQGHEVVVLSREPTPQLWRVVAWDGETLGLWAAELDGADALINLAGRSVNCRYHEKNRQLIFDSRLKSTRILGEAARQCAHPPRVWLQSSTATLYAHRYDAPNNETSGILGGREPDLPATWRFSYAVANTWEQVFSELSLPKTRKVLLRTAIVLSPMPKQAFDILLTLTRLGLGGRAGDGRQYMSWIHDRDFVRALQWLIEHEDISGVVNIAAPNPLPNADFMRTLRQAQGMPIGLPAAAWMIELGSFFMRTESELILKSRRVVPGRLLDGGFTFAYPSWPEAAKDLVARTRNH